MRNLKPHHLEDLTATRGQQIVARAILVADQATSFNRGGKGQGVLFHFIDLDGEVQP